MLWGGNVWGSRTGVQAKRPDPTKKAYALRGHPQAAFSWRWNSNSKAVGGTQPTALPCCPSAVFLGGSVGCLTGSEVGAFTSVPVLPLRQGRHQSDRGRITLARFHSRANLLPSDCANRVRGSAFSTLRA